MRIAKYLLAAFLISSLFQWVPQADAHKKRRRNTDTETVWKSDRLKVSWFGDSYRVWIDHGGVAADWVVVKAGKHSDVQVQEIVVKYLNPTHDHPVKMHFYPYQRLRSGDRVRFKFDRTRKVIGVKVKVEGWSGSHYSDHFRIILKQNVYGPPPDLIQTGYFYGQCIGGYLCPGYRRENIQKFSVDLDRRVGIKRIQFYAHDLIGPTHKAAVNVYVDDQLVGQGIDIKKRGLLHVIDLKHVQGRYITFEAAVNDEAMIERITIDYSPYIERRFRRHGEYLERRKHREREDD